MAFSIVRAETRIVGSDVKYLYEFLVDGSSDTTDLPTDAVPGSKAYSADGSYSAILDTDGSTWTTPAESAEEET